MASSFSRGSSYLRDAKEYARFCRIRGIFLVDGLDLWRTTLRQRGFPEDAVATKLTAAVHFVRSLGDPSSETIVIKARDPTKYSGKN